MSIKIIITERQLEHLKRTLNESNFYDSSVNKLVTDLNMNYEPMIGIIRDSGEYFEEPMIRIKVDDTEITPKELFEYFKKKYKFSDEFIQQVIKDWLFGTLDGNKLSRNVSIS